MTITGSDGSSPLVLARRRGKPDALRYFTKNEVLAFGSWPRRTLPPMSSTLVREIVGNAIIAEWGEVVISLAIKAFL